MEIITFSFKKMQENVPWEMAAILSRSNVLTGVRDLQLPTSAN